MAITRKPDVSANDVMSDRALLELAAKAAGHPIADGYLQESSRGLWWIYIDSNEETSPPPTDSAWTEIWNPLVDDGDALQLAVKAGVIVIPCTGSVLTHGIGQYREYHDDHGGDEMAATRRAIVRAAVAIAQMGDRT